jgi:hypothetical protein
VEHISSRQNPLVKRIRELSRGDGAGDEVLLDGPHLLEEACRSDVDVTLAAFASDAIEGRLAGAAAAARRLAACGLEVGRARPRQRYGLRRFRHRR